MNAKKLVQFFSKAKAVVAIASLYVASMVVLAVGAYFWHLAPYRRGVHSEMSETHHSVFLLQQDALQTLPGPRRAGRYFLQLLLCVGLLVLGLMRLETPGLVGYVLFG